jgi:hypothetical protein
MQFVVNLTDLHGYVKALRSLSERHEKIAIQQTINDLVWEARRRWIQEMQSSFTLRNRWTVGSIRVETAQQSSVDRIRAVIGSVALYMSLQEHGGSKFGTGKHGVRIPTNAAAGQSGGGKRTRPVRGAYRMASIDMAIDPFTGGTIKKRVARSIARARAQGKRFIFLKDGASYGIYKLASMSKGAKMTKLWSMGKTSVHISSQPTLDRASTAAMKTLPHRWNVRLRERLTKCGLDNFKA